MLTWVLFMILINNRHQVCGSPTLLYLVTQISDVVLLSTSHDVGARNERRLVAVCSSRDSGFEVMHGMLNKVMEALGVPLDAASRFVPYSSAKGVMMK